MLACAGASIGDLRVPPTGLIRWFSKTEGSTYATLLHHPLLFGEIQCSAQEVAPLKMLFISILKSSSGTSKIPASLCEGPIYLLLC